MSLTKQLFLNNLVFRNSSNNLHLYSSVYNFKCNYSSANFLLQKYYHKTGKNDGKTISESGSKKIEAIGPCHAETIHMDINQNSVGATKLVQQLNNNSNDSMFDDPKMEKFKSVLDNFIKFLEELTHMDDVRKAQSKVMTLKDQLKESGDLKRKILADLNNIRDEIQKLHSDMRLTNRGSEHHIQLLDYELECIKKERQKQDEFRDADEIERNLFNNLTVAINDSYEKEKIHNQSIRMWSYIQTITASIITFIAAVMGYYFHNNKFGLLAIKFQEIVNNTVKSEIGSMRKDMQVEFDKQERSLEDKFKKLQSDYNKSQESWGGYFMRHTSNVYRYFWPKKQTKD